jgi:hypothetical protein
MIGTDYVAEILGRLHSVVQIGKGKWKARCPAHPDCHPSLHIELKEDDGKVLAICRSQNCTFEAITRAIGLPMSAWFPPRDDFRGSQKRWTNGHASNGKPAGKVYSTIDDAIAEIGRGISQKNPGSSFVARWEYQDFLKKTVAVVARWNLSGGGDKPEKTFRPFSVQADGWRCCDPRGLWPLYRLPSLREGTVFILEGEGKTDLATRLGLNATTSAHGAKSPQKSDWTPLAKRSIVILPDAGKPGEDYAAAVTRILNQLGCTVKIVPLPGLADGEDFVEFVARRHTDGKDPDEVVAEIMALVRAAPTETHAQPSAQEPQSPQEHYRFIVLDSTAFAAADYGREWIVKRAIVRNQPATLAGTKKGMKTGTAIDLGISVASGLPFLGAFNVYKRLRVAIISGESGPFTIQETANRICQAKGIKLADLKDHCFWGFDLPQLTSVIEVAELQRGLKELGIEVMIFDPLYLALLAGAAGAAGEASNLYAMGPRLLAVAKACLSIGCTPILIHHTRLRSGTAENDDGTFKPIDLDDMAFAGIQEFSRQWLLVNRREPYQPGSGLHKIWLTVGGSTGQSGLWSVDIDEGVIGENFQGRRWNVAVKTFDEMRQSKESEKTQRKSDLEAAKDKSDDTRLLAALDVLDPQRTGASYTQVRAQARLNTDGMTRAVLRLKGEGIIEELDEFTVPCGKGRKPARGIVRKNRSASWSGLGQD